MYKYLILFFSIAVLLCVSCKKQEPIELPKIEYDVLLNNHGSNYAWFDHVEGFQRIDFFTLILEAAQSGKYKLEDMNGNALIPDSLKKYLTVSPLIDSVKTIIVLDAEQLNGIRFREEWKVDSKTGEIEKNVIAFCPVYFHRHPFIDNSDVSEIYPLFWIYPGKSDEKPESMQITQAIAYDVVIDNTLPQVRSVYGENSPFYFCNIESSYRKSIINAIVDAGLNKKTDAYDFFFKEITKDELKLIGERHDTLNVFYGKYEENMKDSIVTTTLDRNKILRLKFAEVWTIDKNTLQFTKNIIALGPSEISYDSDGEFKGFRFLFWLMFDKSKMKYLVFD